MPNRPRSQRRGFSLIPTLLWIGAILAVLLGVLACCNKKDEPGRVVTPAPAQMQTPDPTPASTAPPTTWTSTTTTSVNPVGVPPTTVQTTGPVLVTTTTTTPGTVIHRTPQPTNKIDTIFLPTTDNVFDRDVYVVGVLYRVVEIKRSRVDGRVIMVRVQAEDRAASQSQRTEGFLTDHPKVIQYGLNQVFAFDDPSLINVDTIDRSRYGTDYKKIAP